MRKPLNLEYVSPDIGQCWFGWWDALYLERSRFLYDHELVVFSSGRCQVVVGERSFICSKGDALIIPPGVRHWSRALDSRVERYCVHFDWIGGLERTASPFVYEFVDPFQSRLCKDTPDWLGVAMPFHQSGVSLSRILPLLRLVDECGECPVERLMARGAFMQVLAELLREGEAEHVEGKGGKSLRLVQALKRRIEQDFRQALCMKTLAGELGVSPVHMIRAFRRKTGATPLSYVHQLRLDEAMRLLKASSMNVAEIAAAVGFEDANYFSRLFKKKTGMSPSEAMSAC